MRPSPETLREFLEASYPPPSEAARRAVTHEADALVLWDGAERLDEVMRAMFERYPLSGPGYTSDDLVAVLNGVVLKLG